MKLSAVFLASTFVSTAGLRAAEPAADGTPQSEEKVLEAEGEAPAEGGAASGAKKASRGGIEEIIVSAQRREQSLQEVPVTVSAVSGDMLKSAGVTDLFALGQYTPNVYFVPNGDARTSRVSIRGVTSRQDNIGQQSSVGMFVDGIFMARTGMATNDLLDIERLEVLRGPQGTLFGMNTAAGLINIVTRKPDMQGYHTYGEATTGNYGLMDFRGSVTGPIVEDKVAFSLSAFRTTRDGYGENTFRNVDIDNQNKWGARAKLLLKPADNLEISVIADHNREDSKCCNGYAYATVPGTSFSTTYGQVLPPPHVNTANTENYNKVWGNGLSIEANLDWAGHTWTSVSGMRTWKVMAQSDLDSTSLAIVDITYDQAHHQYSQELRVSSPTGQRFEYVGGLFFFKWQANEVGPYIYGADVVGANANKSQTRLASMEDTSHAVFGQLTYHVTDQLGLTGGLRYTREKMVGGIAQISTVPAWGSFPMQYRERKEKQLTWTAIANYQWNDDIMTYASVSRGFKPGGFDNGRFPNAAALDTRYEFEEETSINYEVGAKTAWFDNRLHLNVALFRNIFSDFQASTFNGASLVTSNAKQFTSEGVEIESKATPFENFDLTANLGYNHTRYDDFENGNCPFGKTNPCSLTGRRLHYAPVWNFDASAQYTMPIKDTPLSVFVRGEYNWRSMVYFEQSLEPNSVQGAYGLVNGRIGLRNEEQGWTVELWGKNLLDKAYGVSAYAAPSMTGTWIGYYGEPRTLGVRTSISF
ncbi:MAG: TonB-dependent receptor [Parvibaculum sp.]|uniref:TonB-dependent receptor n=1 Tax=Parvibaculum sp. TaxID=2024848 RepID=UPI003C731157